MATKYLDYAGLSTYDRLIKQLIDTYGREIDVSIDNTTYALTVTLLDANGNTLSTGTIDLPLESVVVNGSYDSTNQRIVLTLVNGGTINIPVADLVSGLATQSDLDSLEDRVEDAEGDIANLQTTVGGHTTTINNILANYVSKANVDQIIQGNKTFSNDVQVGDLTNGVALYGRNSAAFSGRNASGQTAATAISTPSSFLFNIGGTNYYRFGVGGAVSSPATLLSDLDVTSITTSEINALFS